MNAFPKLQETLSVQQLAQRWNVTPMTLRRWRKAGRIPVVRIGPRRLLFRMADVEAVETANLIGGTRA